MMLQKWTGENIRVVVLGLITSPLDLAEDGVTW